MLGSGRTIPPKIFAVFGKVGNLEIVGKAPSIYILYPSIRSCKDVGVPNKTIQNPCVACHGQPKNQRDTVELLGPAGQMGAAMADLMHRQLVELATVPRVLGAEMAKC